MKTRCITITAAALMTSLFTGPTLADNEFEIGFAADYRNLNLGDGDVPASVAREAANPSITNPYSGNFFDKSVIGAYGPGDRFEFYEPGIYAKYTFDLGHAWKPFLRGEFQYPCDVSTHEGEYGDGYTYDRVLGEGADFVRYTYGIEYRYPYYFEPEIGIKWDVSLSAALEFGISLQRLELEYYKGIEAWGKTRNLQKLGSSSHDLINYKLRLTREWGAGNTALYLEPVYTSGDGISGFGIGINLAFYR